MTRDERKSWIARGYKDPFKAFAAHAASAHQRSIPFLFTFHDWWLMWEPHYHNRGTGKGQKVMCRTADQGPYVTSNVRIATKKENAQEAALEHRTAKAIVGRAPYAAKQKLIPLGIEWLSRGGVFKEYEETLDY